MNLNFNLELLAESIFEDSFLCKVDSSNVHKIQEFQNVYFDILQLIYF